MNPIKDLERRGLLDAFSDKEKIENRFEHPVTVYCGFDPSARSLQLGNFAFLPRANGNLSFKKVK